MISVAYLVILATSALASRVSYDAIYDNSTHSLATVTCSTGSNGLITKGFTTFGSLPGFPHIGGAAAVKEFNSDMCGSCWALTFNNLTINILAIDGAREGFNIAISTMDLFTGGKAVEVGVIDASAKRVQPSVCGL